MNIAYAEFDDKDYSRLRRALLSKRGSTYQRGFLESVRDSGGFMDFIRSEVRSSSGLVAPLCSDRLTEGEYKNPPSSTEMELYAAWDCLTPSVACRTTFWAELTCRHIEEGRIESVYLAANGGSLPGGAERIDLALGGQGEDSEKKIDQCVRTVLRRLSGLIGERGHVTIYTDCPFARAWWRERLVDRIAEGDPDIQEKVREVIRINPTYWETLMVQVVSRNSVLGSDKILHALILCLAEFISINQDTILRNAQGLRRICRIIATRQSLFELSILTEKELRDFIDEAILNVHAQAQP